MLGGTGRRFRRGFSAALYRGTKRGLKFRPALTHPRLGRLAWLALPLIVGQSVVVLDEQFVRIFGSLGGEGAVSLLNYARRIMMVPVGVVARRRSGLLSLSGVTCGEEVLGRV